MHTLCCLNREDGSRFLTVKTPGSGMGSSPRTYDRGSKSPYGNMNSTSNQSQGASGRERVYGGQGSGAGGGGGRGGRQGDMLYDRVMSSVAERVAVAAAERGRALGCPFSLLKQFQAYDDGQGYVTEKAFETTIGKSEEVSESQ